jgi:hypothetical protein
MAATHGFHFHKERLEPGAGTALPLCHRIVFAAKGTATVAGEALTTETANHSADGTEITAGPEGAELWRWDLAPMGTEPMAAAGDGVSSELIQVQPIDTLPLDTRDSWAFRADGTIIGPGLVTPLHLHPGPGMRCMIEGALSVETLCTEVRHEVGDWWYETNVHPVTARSDAEMGTRFIRAMVLPPELAGFPTVHCCDPADAVKLRERYERGAGGWLNYVEKIVSL